MQKSEAKIYKKRFNVRVIDRKILKQLLFEL